MILKKSNECLVHISIQFAVKLIFVVLSEQDQGLEALSGIIQRQKLMGQAISDEVDLQNGQYLHQTPTQHHSFFRNLPLLSFLHLPFSIWANL